MTVVMLSLAIIPMSGLMLKESRQTAMGRTRTFALHLASNMIERFKMEHLNALKIMLDNPTSSQGAISSIRELNPTADSPEFNQMMNMFKRTAWLEIDPASNGRKAVLKVQVQWDERGHKRQLERSIIIINSYFPTGKAN